MAKKSTESFAFQFRNFLDSKGFTLLGGGAFSKVFAKNDSRRVIKVASCMDGWPAYVLWANQAGYGGTFAPKLYSLDVRQDNKGRFVYVAVMERLSCTVSEKNGERYSAEKSAMINQYDLARDFAYKAHDYRGGEFPASIIKDFRDRGLSQGWIDFLIAFENQFDGGRDLHDGNWMFRADGSLVLTDPLSYNNYTESSTRVRNKPWKFRPLGSFAEMVEA